MTTKRPRLDPRHVAVWIVAALIAVFGVSAAFTDRDPLSYNWIALIFGVLGITIATSKEGGSDDDDDTTWLGRVGRARRPPAKVARPVDHEPPRNDRGRLGGRWVRRYQPRF